MQFVFVIMSLLKKLGIGYLLIVGMREKSSLTVDEVG